eukprot:Seg606.3 transcript_id=Seg606.3/GoldUCD/mRNA.D3Y31 product="piRNA biogenesis protein EXD1" protein_id=Seg606.3/GoldUCD/D3Y31
MSADHVGKEICVSTDDGKFYGTIHSVDGKHGKLILQKVSMEDGSNLRGLQIFFTNEIKDLQLLSGNADEETANDGDLDSSPTGLDANQNIEEEESSLSAKDPSDEGPRLIARKPLNPGKYLTGDDTFMTKSREEDFNDPPEVILVNEFGEKFDSALENINEQRVVGISAEGDKIGRSGKLCLLVIGCRRVTYVFDVFKLGEESLSKGLRALLEDCYILKVVHDCRLLSDCLFNQYQTQLKNIFDTQVADIIIFKQKRGRLPTVVNGLEACLYEYLNISPEKCRFYSVIGKSLKSNAYLWTTRPLAEELLNAVAEKVLFLRELRITQMENMMAEFLHGVDIYLGVFRDSNMNSSETLRHIRKVPDPFYRLKNISERRWKAYKDKDEKIDSGDEFQFDNGAEAAFAKSGNGGWTEGKQFAANYQKKHGKIVERDDLDQKGRRSYFDNEPRVDKRNAPWRMIKEKASENGESSETSIVFRSESIIREQNKAKATSNLLNGRTSYANSSRNYSNVAQHSVGKFAPNAAKSSESQVDYKEAEKDGKIVNCQEEKREEAKVNDSNNSRNFLEDKQSSTGSISKNQGQPGSVLSENQSYTGSVLSAIPRKKVPIDWFDCDTPSTDRSRSSSVDSGPSAKPKGVELPAKQHLQPSPNSDNDYSKYDQEYPALSPDSRKSSPDRPCYESSPSTQSQISGSSANSSPYLRSDQYSRPEVGIAKRDLFGRASEPRGVQSDAQRPHAAGRAKMRDFYAAPSSPVVGGSAATDMPKLLSRTFGTVKTHAFPSDDDLLRTNPIIRAEHTGPVHGERVKIDKITNILN